VDVDSRVILEKTLKTSVRYYSICLVYNDLFAVTTMDSQLPVRLINTQGIEEDIRGRFHSKMYFNYISYCAFTEVSRIFVWTDRDSIHIVNDRSGANTTVTEDSIAATGVAVGPDGYIYVSSFDTKSVVYISPHGKIIGSFAVGLYPVAISVSNDGNSLVVASKYEIKLFKINRTPENIP